MNSELLQESQVVHQSVQELRQRYQKNPTHNKYNRASMSNYYGVDGPEFCPFTTLNDMTDMCKIAKVLYKPEPHAFREYVSVMIDGEYDFMETGRILIVDLLTNQILCTSDHVPEGIGFGDIQRDGLFCDALWKRIGEISAHNHRQRMTPEERHRADEYDKLFSGLKTCTCRFFDEDAKCLCDPVTVLSEQDALDERVNTFIGEAYIYFALQQATRILEGKGIYGDELHYALDTLEQVFIKVQTPEQPEIGGTFIEESAIKLIH